MVQIDLSRDALLSEGALTMLRERYMLPHETSPQEAFARASAAFADDEAHAQRLYDYVSRGWFMFATPLLSNGGSERGLPISCFLNYVGDDRESILENYVENAWLSSVGGGIGSYWGATRGPGGKSYGALPFMHCVDSEMLAWAQGTTRRGSCAVYLDISHPEIEEFIVMRKPSGGDENRKNLNLHHGVNITDDFMSLIEQVMYDADFDDSWPLIDPHSKQVVKTVRARELWRLILETRHNTGEPYLFFIDTANASLPEEQKKLGLKVHHSNLCTEITLPTDKDRTAVCCLSSVNIAKYDEWKTCDEFIEDLMRMLDNTLQKFIDATGSGRLAEPMRRSHYSAMRERSVGLGAMGFHDYLQSKFIAFESAMAVSLNNRIFDHIESRATAASFKLGLERGAAPDMEKSGHRFAHRTAIAPNASSGIILDTSPSIEPLRANAYLQKTLSGSKLRKNPHLERILHERSSDADQLWEKIISNAGSVQDLDCLTDHEKAVFKTADEIDQRWIVQHAADRQKYICQAQSINLFFPNGTPIPYLHAVHFQAWKQGLKSLYYLRSDTVSRAENITHRVAVKEMMEAAVDEEVCLACEG